jgi:hypothetical protein
MAANGEGMGGRATGFACKIELDGTREAPKCKVPLMITVMTHWFAIAAILWPVKGMPTVEKRPKYRLICALHKLLHLKYLWQNVQSRNNSCNVSDFLGGLFTAGSSWLFGLKRSLRMIRETYICQ